MTIDPQEFLAQQDDLHVEVATPTVFEVPEDMAKWIDVYRLAAAKEKELAETKKTARDQLVMLAQLHKVETLTREGIPACTVKPKNTTRLDTAKFKTEHPDLYEEYAVKGVTVELRIK